MDHAGISTHSAQTQTGLVPWEGRAILLVDLDAFFASVEQLDHPAWKGKPVIVGGDADKRGVVSTCSYEARRYGVRSAMPASSAARLCPDAIWVPGRYGRYRQVSHEVMSILEDETPFVQQVSIDEAFLDISPTPINPEHPVLVAMRIQERVAGLGITCSIGLGPSKSVAKVASDIDKPQGLTVVYPGRQEAFLSGLPIACMSGIGPASQRRLTNMGIHTLGDVVAADDALLLPVFGKNVQMMKDRCRGSDADAVVVDEPVKSVSNEVSFATDLHERTDIEAALASVAAKVCRRLRKHKLAGRTITLKIRYGDRDTHSVSRTLDAPTCDEYALLPLLNNMLDQVWSYGMSVRLVGVAVSRFDEGFQAPERLFNIEECASEQPTIGRSEREALMKATDAVRNRFGESAVRYGREVRTAENLTGSSSKNPADYRSHPNDREAN